MATLNAEKIATKIKKLFFFLVTVFGFLIKEVRIYRQAH